MFENGGNIIAEEVACSLENSLRDAQARVRRVVELTKELQNLCPQEVAEKLLDGVPNVRSH